MSKMRPETLVEVALKFKTLRCTGHHSSTKNDSCHYFHDENDRRRPQVDPASGSLLYFNILYIPKLVPETQREKFALNLFEYTYHILNFKTKPCPYRSMGSACPLESLCPYLHKEDQVSALTAYRRKVHVPDFQMVCRPPSPEFVEESPKVAPKPKSVCLAVLPGNEEAYIRGRADCSPRRHPRRLQGG